MPPAQEIAVPEVLTTDEAAALLRIHINTLRELAAAGNIPCRKVGNAYRFSRNAVLDWISGSKVRAAPHRGK